MRSNVDMQDYINRLGKHKVIDIDRDYRTGKVEFVEREKPDQAMVNSARILMRNADSGRLESETIAHNIVHTRLLNAYGFLTTCYNRVSPKEVTLMDPFGAIILSDYDGAESQDDLIVGGNVLGWAGKTTTYVGTDAYKGTYTAADSNITDGLRTGSIKYVYDWPRNAGNGTIKSVWWNYCSGGESGVAQELYNPTYWGSSYSSWPSMVDCCCDGTYLWAVNNDEYVKKYNLATGALVETITFQAGIKLRGIDWDGTNFWIQNDGGTCQKCAAATFAIIDTIPTISTVSPINGIAVVGGKIYVSTSVSIYRYTIAGVSEHEYSPTDFGATGFYKIKGNDKYLVVVGTKTTGYRFAQLNVTDGSIRHVKDAQSGNGVFHYQYFTFIRNNQYKSSRVFVGKQLGYNASYWQWYMLPTPGAHTKLPTAKVKDNTTTMTVEYNFNCDLSHLD